MNKLQKIAQEQDLAKSDITKLVEAFGGPFEEAGEILATYKDIKVTDESQIDLMNQAREKRLLLKKARTTVENKRKELKADIVKQGKAIDSVARYVKEEIEPAEEYLQLQEKFVEIKKAKEAEALKAERVEKLMQYTDDIGVYNLDTMTSEQFDGLLATLKSQHEAKLKAEADAKKKAEEEAEAERKRQAEIEKENAKLKKEAEDREKAERVKAQAERDEAERLSGIAVSLKKYAHNNQTVEDCEKSLEGLQKEYAGLSAEDQEHDRIKSAFEVSQAELKQFIIHLKEKAQAEADRKAQLEKEEAEKKALLSPDKDLSLIHI